MQKVVSIYLYIHIYEKDNNKEEAISLRVKREQQRSRRKGTWERQ